MSEGSEFQVVEAATEKARRARSVLVLGAPSSVASDDRRCRTHINRRVSMHCNRYDPSSGRCRHMHWTHLSLQSRLQPAGLL